MNYQHYPPTNDRNTNKLSTLYSALKGATNIRIEKDIKWKHTLPDNNECFPNAHAK